MSPRSSKGSSTERRIYTTRSGSKQSEGLVEYVERLVEVRLVRVGNYDQGKVIRGPADVYQVCEYLRDADREITLGLYLNTRNRIDAVSELSKGSLNAAIVHPREVYKPAILANAHAVILVHNHPSGDPTPSGDDLALTERIKEAGVLLGVPLLDHVIIGQDCYRSLKEDGKI